MLTSVQTISATQSDIRIRMTAPVPEGAQVSVIPYPPLALGAIPQLPPIAPTVDGDTLTFPRNACGRDGLCLIYTVQIGNHICDGVRYVESVEDAARTYPYPVVDTKKGLQIVDTADAAALGVRHSAINVNQGDFLLPAPEEGNTLEFAHDGRTFYFRRSHVERMDKVFRDLSEIGCVVTFILLNSPRWRCDIDPAFWRDVLMHPDYTGPGSGKAADGSSEGTGLISMFNLVTEEGLAHYRAFIAFLTDRYTREDMAYGRVVGMIVGNEVDAGYIWCNAGEKSMEWFTREYLNAMRVTWQTAAAIYAHMRVYISLDHFWNSAMDARQPLRYYNVRDMLVYLNDIARAEGQLPWHIAYHPYPEDLNYPDFWNDRLATPDDDAPIVTFKNLEVLARFTYREEFLYRGERRRIILSEQGFNSHWTPESEILQATAYGRAYRKVMEIPEIDSFILHAHHDNRGEFGLNLGLVRRKKDEPGMDGPKPIYHVFKAIDQKDERGRWHWERY